VRKNAPRITASLDHCIAGSPDLWIIYCSDNKIGIFYVIYTHFLGNQTWIEEKMSDVRSFIDFRRNIDRSLGNRHKGSAD
jgi:hypothetical protein